jgi:dynein heavy chain
MEVYQQVETFRRHTGNLDLIVNMYNDIQTNLLPVERPLVKSQLERIDKALAQGTYCLLLSTRLRRCQSCR